MRGIDAVFARQQRWPHQPVGAFQLASRISAVPADPVAKRRVVCLGQYTVYPAGHIVGGEAVLRLQRQARLRQNALHICPHLRINHAVHDEVVTVPGTEVGESGVAGIVSIQLAHLLRPHVVYQSQAGEVRSIALEGMTVNGEFRKPIGPHQQRVSFPGLLRWLGHHTHHQGLDDTNVVICICLHIRRQRVAQQLSKPGTRVSQIGAQDDV